MKKQIITITLLFFAFTTFSQRTLVAPEATGKIFPRWVNGDRDFWGQGPKFSGKVRVAISEGKSQLYAYLDLVLEEMAGDHSMAKINESRLIYSAPAGKQIKAIINPSGNTTTMNVNLTRGGISRLNAPRNGPVSHFIVNGDGESKDIGNNSNDDSYVSVFFSGMVIELEPLPAGIQEININKKIFGGVVQDKLNGTRGKINTYGPRHGDSWFKPKDAWIKFPNDIREDTMYLDAIKEIPITPRRYYYNDIRLQTVQVNSEGKYLQIKVNWESEGPEIRGECVNDAGCMFGSPSVQLDNFKILINLRPSVSGGKLTYDEKDIQVRFTYKFSADCGVLADLCKEVFKDPLESALFRSSFIMSDIMKGNETRTQISNSLTDGILQYIRAFRRNETVSQIIDVRDAGNNIVIRYR